MSSLASNTDGTLASQHFIHDDANTPSVNFLQQYKKQATPVISHFHFFTPSHIFTSVSRDRKIVVCTVNFSPPDLYWTFLCMISSSYQHGECSDFSSTLSLECMTRNSEITWITIVFNSNYTVILSFHLTLNYISNQVSIINKWH